MSNLFLNIRRPKAEQNIINNFIKCYKKGMTLYKSKEYNKALNEFRTAYDFLQDIWDEYPKICTLYLIMKSLFHNRNYGECLSLHDELVEKMKLEKIRDYSKKKNNMFIKIEAKMDAYHLLINFIMDNSNKSIECALNMIKFLSQDTNMSLEEKTIYFYNYIKSFIQISGITKHNIFKHFKTAYDTMIVEEKINSENYFNETFIAFKYSHHNNKKINPSIIDSYKSLMNAKLKTLLYEILDSEYYLLNFGLEKDKVVNFLHKNMSIYVYEKNLEKLLNLFTVYITLGKVDLKKKFNMTMNQIIFLQKSRMEDFDVIFSNLTGGFFHIFKNYMQAEKKSEKKLYFSKPTLNINKLKALRRNDMNLIKTYRDRKSFGFNLTNLKAETTKNMPITLHDSYNFNKSGINVIKSQSKIEKKNIFSDMLNKKKKMVKIKYKLFKKSKIDNFRLNSAKQTNSTFTNKNIQSSNSYLSEKETDISFKRKFPDLINKTSTNKKTFKLNFSEGSLLKKNNFIKNKNYKNNINEERENSEEKNNKENDNKEKKNSLRNINHILINILINLFTPILKLENNLYIEQEKINYKKIFPRRLDLYKDPELKSIIKSYHYHWSPNSFLKENHNSFLYNDNFLLIQNLKFLGICRGYGNTGKPISNRLANLFSCILQYIMIEDSLKHDNKEINKEIYKLFKAKENSKYFKDMFLLKYILFKFQIDIKNIPLLKNNALLIKKQIKEAFYISLKELNNRYLIKTDISFINILVCFIIEKIIYIFHSGYFEMIVGKYNNKSHDWENKTLVKPTEFSEENFKTIFNISQNKTIIKKKKENIVNKSNSEFEKSKNNEYYIEEDKESKELELYKYQIEQDDRFIVIGSKGIFNDLTNEEIINAIGEYYINNKNPDEAAFHLIDLIKNKQIMTKKLNNYYYDKEKEDENIEKEIENEKFLGYYNDLACIIIFLPK